MFNKTIYDIFNGRDDGFNYLEFIGWVCLWGAIFHWIAAVTNGQSFSSILDTFCSDIDERYSCGGTSIRHSILMRHVWVLCRYCICPIWYPSGDSTIRSIVHPIRFPRYPVSDSSLFWIQKPMLKRPSSLALITLITPHYFNAVARSGYVNRQFRRFCSDYGMPITIIAATGLAYWGRFDRFVLLSISIGCLFKFFVGMSWNQT